MPDDKLVSLEGMKVLAQQTKSYVDGAIASAGSGTTDIQQGDTIKTFSDDMKTITSVLTDSEGKVIATEIKTFSDDGLTISTNVVYGESDAN